MNVRTIWLTLCALSGATRGRIVPSIVLTRRWGRFRKTRCEPDNSNNVSHLSGSGSISVMRRRPVGVVLPGHSTATFPERYAQLTGFVALDAAASASRTVGQNPVSGTDLPRYLALFTACPGGHAPEVPNSVVRTVPDNLANHTFTQPVFSPSRCSSAKRAHPERGCSRGLNPPVSSSDRAM